MGSRLPVESFLKLKTAVVGVWIICLVCAGCASHPKKVVQAYEQGDYQAVMEYTRPKLTDKSRNLALHNLRYASAAMCCDDYDEARDALGRACMVMEDFEPDGEWKAVVVAEKKKDYRGDPYEKMYAFLLLGILDYMAGEYDKALACFKTAALADAGSRQERYNADCPLVYFMQGKAYSRLGETAQARDAFDMAKKAARFRVAVRLADNALVVASLIVRARFEEDRARKKAAASVTGIIFDYVSGAASDTLSARNAVEESCRRAMAEAAGLQGTKEWKKRFGKLTVLDVRQITAMIEKRAITFLENVNRTGEVKETESLIAAIDDASSDDINCLVFVVMGRGPRKQRFGEYGEILRIVPQKYPENSCAVQFSEHRLRGPVPFADMYYQASTRGGREMDAILKGKAVFKDVTAAASEYALAMSVLDTPGGHRGGDAALLMAAVGLTFAVVSVATNPQADIRCWEMVPDRVELAYGRLEPGRYDVTVDFFDASGNCLPGRSHRYQAAVVPAKGEVVLCLHSGMRPAAAQGGSEKSE